MISYGFSGLDSALKRIIKDIEGYLKAKKLLKADLYKNNPTHIIFKFYNDEEKIFDEVYVTIIKDKKILK